MKVVFRNASGNSATLTLPNNVDDNKLNAMFGEGNWTKEIIESNELISESKMKTLGIVTQEDKLQYLEIVKKGIEFRFALKNFFEKLDIKVASGIYIGNKEIVSKKKS